MQHFSQVYSPVNIYGLIALLLWTGGSQSGGGIEE